MEKISQIAPPVTRSLNFKKSFRLGIRSLLTICSKEDFARAFPRFTDAEQSQLLQLFIQVVSSLHENIEEQFVSLSLETQVVTTLDAVDQLVEEQSLDPLFSQKTNVHNTVQSLLTEKKMEIQYLREMLEKAEDQNRIIKDRVDLLRKEKKDFSGAVDALVKLRAGILNYEAGKDAMLNGR